MNLTNLFNKSTAKIEQKSIPVGQTVQYFSMGPAPVSNNGASLLDLNKGYVYSCNNKNSIAVASANLKLYTTVKTGQKMASWVKTNKVSYNQQKFIKTQHKKSYISNAENIEEIIEHPFLDLLDTVNTRYDRFSLFENTEGYLGLIGNCYWKLIKDSNGRIEKLDILPSEYVSVKLDNQNEVIGYRFNYNSIVKDYTKDEIVHFKNIIPGTFANLYMNNNVTTGLYGMGALEACLVEVLLLNGINTYQRAMANNNGRPDFVVSYLGKLEEKVKKELYHQWNKLFRGNENAGKVQITEGGFEIKNLGFAPKDLEFEKGKEYLRSVICNAFGVPEDLVHSGNSNRASSTTAIQQYYQFTIFPKLRRIADTINQSILSQYDSNLFCAFEDPTPENQELRTKTETLDISNGVLSINEVRVQRGLEAFADAKYDLPIEKGNTI